MSDLATWSLVCAIVLAWSVTFAVIQRGGRDKAETE